MISLRINSIFSLKLAPAKGSKRRTQVECLSNLAAKSHPPVRILINKFQGFKTNYMIKINFSKNRYRMTRMKNNKRNLIQKIQLLAALQKNNMS